MSKTYHPGLINSQAYKSIQIIQVKSLEKEKGISINHRLFGRKMIVQLPLFIKILSISNLLKMRRIM